MMMLQQELSSWLTLTNALIAILIFCIAVVGALIVIASKRREELHSINSQRADASDKLVKVRDTELADSEKKCAKLQEELEDTTAELRVLSGVNLEKLVAYWCEYELFQAKFGKIQQENRVLRLQLGMSDPPNN